MRILRNVSLGVFLAGSAVGIHRVAKAQDAGITDTRIAQRTDQKLNEQETRALAPLFEELRTDFSALRTKAREKEGACLKPRKEKTIECVKASVVKTKRTLSYSNKCVRPELRTCEREVEDFLRSERKKRMIILEGIKKSYNLYSDLDNETQERLIALEVEIEGLNEDLGLDSDNEDSPAFEFDREMSGYADIAYSELRQAEEATRQKATEEAMKKIHREPKAEQKPEINKIIDAISDVFSFIRHTLSWIINAAFYVGIGWYAKKITEAGVTRKIYDNEMSKESNRFLKLAKTLGKMLLAIAATAINDLNNYLEKRHGEQNRGY